MYTYNCLSSKLSCALKLSVFLHRRLQQRSPRPMSQQQWEQHNLCQDLPWSADEDTIAEFFGDCGTVANVRIGETF